MKLRAPSSETGVLSDENEFRLRPLRIADASATKLDIESGVRGSDPADDTAQLRFPTEVINLGSKSRLIFISGCSLVASLFAPFRCRPNR